MTQTIIRYKLTNAAADEWHRDIAKFIAALDTDPAIDGRISYRVMKSREGNDYYHIATPADDDAVKALQQSAFFKPYQERTRQVAGGEVIVSPLELVAETKRKA
jgi:quinol monooxygenase YgiN